MAVRRSRWFVYILRCADGTLYTGATTDVSRRVEQHNAGTASRYTRSRRPVAVVYQKRVADQSSALKREAAIKKLSRQDKEALVATKPLRRAR
jgi:putative endonuclease